MHRGATKRQIQLIIRGTLQDPVVEQYDGGHALWPEQLIQMQAVNVVSHDNNVMGFKQYSNDSSSSDSYKIWIGFFRSFFFR